MSRIGTETQAPLNRASAQGMEKANQAKPSTAVGNAGMIRQVRSRLADSFKVKSKKTRHLTSATEISDTELQPLSGRKRDQMVG